MGDEGVELIDLLADPDELDRLAGDGAHRERGPAAGVAVEFGQDQAGDTDRLVEVGGHADRLLAGGGVGDEQRFARLEEGGDTFQLLDQGVVDFLAAGGVEDDGGGILGFQPFDGAFGGFEDVFFARFRGEHGHADVVGEYLELLDGGRAVEVEGDEDRALPVFFEAAGEFRAGGGFAGAVQAADEDVTGRVEVQRGLVAAEQGTQFVMENLDDLLAGRDRFQHLVAHGAYFDRLDKGLGHAQFHVRLEQGEPHVAHGVGHIGLGDFAEAAELFDRAFKAVAQLVKHGVSCRRE